MLWNIFVIPGAWASLITDTWIIPMNKVLRDLPMTIFWEWPPQLTPHTLDSSHLVRWLGQKAGVTPTRAWQLLKPYADHQNQGCYYSPKAQVAHNQAKVKWAHWARNNLLLAGPGMAGLPMGSLAACISTAPITDASEPAIVPIVGAPPLAGPLAPLPTMSTSMDVDYGSPLTDPLSEGNKNDTSGQHEDLDVPVSMLPTWLHFLLDSPTGFILWGRV